MRACDVPPRKLSTRDLAALGGRSRGPRRRPPAAHLCSLSAGARRDRGRPSGHDPHRPGTEGGWRDPRPAPGTHAAPVADLIGALERGDGDLAALIERSGPAQGCRIAPHLVRPRRRRTPNLHTEVGATRRPGRPEVGEPCRSPAPSRYGVTGPGMAAQLALAAIETPLSTVAPPRRAARNSPAAIARSRRAHDRSQGSRRARRPRTRDEVGEGPPDGDGPAAAHGPLRRRARAHPSKMREPRGAGGRTPRACAHLRYSTASFPAPAAERLGLPRSEGDNGAIREGAWIWRRTPAGGTRRKAGVWGAGGGRTRLGRFWP